MEPERVIIIDSNPKFVSLVREILTDEGYNVMAAFNGERAVKMTAVEQPDLMILDIVLNGEMDGFEVTRRVREFSEIPIMVLTSQDNPQDMVYAFENGADDYVLKPFNSKVLLARVRAILKRSRHSAPPQTESEINLNKLKIDLPCRKVTLDGLEVCLSETEYNLLLELARHVNEVLLHEDLLLAVWGPQFVREVDYLRSYIHMLRRKIEPYPGSPKRIISKSGVGYMLIDPPVQTTGD